MAEVNGLIIHLVAEYPKGETGDGPAVVLVHGGQAWAYTWRHQLEPLAGAGYRVIAPDLPGSGYSDLPRDYDYSIGAVLLRVFNSLAAIATLVYLIASRWMRWSALPLPAWSRWIGVVAGFVTVALFLWVHRALGENWSTSVEPKEQHALVTSGPYRWVRHPMYTTMFVWTLAFFLLSANWFVGITWLALSILAASRAGEEEAALVEKFGTEYRAYMQRTGRFLPGLGH